MLRGNARGLAVVVVALGIATPTLSDAAQSPRVSILDLKRNPSLYEGKVVRVQGQFDQCAGGVTCNFCPADMTRVTFDENRCLPLGFRSGYGASLPEGNFTPLMHRLYKFSTVTLEATFTSLCLRDENANPIGDVLCTGWPANLYLPRVLEVHSRKSASDGLVTQWGDIGPLIPPPPGEREAMQQELARVTLGSGTGPGAVFSIQLSPQELENKERGDDTVMDALGCVCLEPNCDGKWPTRAFYGMNAPTNPYDCWFMQDREGGWRVLLQQF
jgi:hypothetical protein